MIAAILTIVIAMLVYIFWFLRSEVSRIMSRIDESAIAISNMNNNMMTSVTRALTQPVLPGLDDYEDDEDDEDAEEDEDYDEEEAAGEEAAGEEADGKDEDKEEGFVEEQPTDASAGEADHTVSISTGLQELDEITSTKPKRGRKKIVEKNNGGIVV